jgi:hypothetical protein
MWAKWMDPNSLSKKCSNIMRLEPTLLETCPIEDESEWYRESGYRSVWHRGDDWNSVNGKSSELYSLVGRQVANGIESITDLD